MGIAAAEKKPPKRSEAAVTVASPSGKGSGSKMRSYTFGGLDIDGRLKTPQLLYFLNRMRSEFDSTAPSGRSFLPELKRSTEEM